MLLCLGSRQPVSSGRPTSINLLSLLSLAGINTMTIERKGFISFDDFRSQSVIEGSHGRNSGREPGGIRTNDYGKTLVFWLSPRFTT